MKRRKHSNSFFRVLTYPVLPDLWGRARGRPTLTTAEFSGENYQQRGFHAQRHGICDGLTIRPSHAFHVPKNIPKNMGVDTLKVNIHHILHYLFLVKLLMHLQKDFVFNFVMPKCQQKGLLSHATAREMTHVASWVAT